MFPARPKTDAGTTATQQPTRLARARTHVGSHARSLSHGPNQAPRIARLVPALHATRNFEIFRKFRNFPFLAILAKMTQSHQKLEVVSS